MPTSVREPIDPAVLPLAGRLQQRGLLADVQTTVVCGDPDVRLVVCRRDGTDLSVELLATLVTEPAPEHWQAVLVRASDRQVWQGPRRDAPAEEVVALVEALLSGELERAAGRYVLLG